MALIITGHQRSGTTLLLRLCNSHPDIYITGEFGNFQILDTPYPNYVRLILRRWLQKRNASFLYESRSRLKGVNAANNLVFVLRYLNALTRHYRNGASSVGVPVIESALKDLFPDKRIVGDKYPDYAFHLKMLTARENLSTLFIYRDPRDVASSSVKRARSDWRNTWPADLRNAKNIATRWVWMIELWEQFQNNVFPVRYENLVTQPESVLEEIACWLSVDPIGFKHNIIRKDSLGKHASGLTDREIDEVLAIAGPTMLRVGYTF